MNRFHIIFFWALSLCLCPRNFKLFSASPSPLSVVLLRVRFVCDVCPLMCFVSLSKYVRPIYTILIKFTKIWKVFFGSSRKMDGSLFDCPAQRKNLNDFRIVCVHTRRARRTLHTDNFFCSFKNNVYVGKSRFHWFNDNHRRTQKPHNEKQKRIKKNLLSTRPKKYNGAISGWPAMLVQRCIEEWIKNTPHSNKLEARECYST